MTETKKQQLDGNLPKILAVIILSLPLLSFQMAMLWLRFKANAKNGGRIFRKELIQQGIDQTTADALTDIYLESSSVTGYFRALR